jgi:hypothetical protein
MRNEVEGPHLARGQGQYFPEISLDCPSSLEVSPSPTLIHPQSKQSKAAKPLSSSQAIERLDAQIDMMLAAAAQDRSGYRPFSKGQIGCYPAEMEDDSCISDQMKTSSGLAPAPRDEIHGKQFDAPYSDEGELP